MAKQLSKEERQEVEKNLQVCRNAVQTFESMLEADSAATKAVEAQSNSEIIKAAAKRDGTRAGILLARELGRRGGPPE
jgi:hypothetical protein